MDKPVDNFVDKPVEKLILTDRDAELGLRPLTARSLIASMLLGTHPPVLPTRALVASARLFGVSDGAARTALSRMATAGELRADGRSYALGDALASRQGRQMEGRAAQRREWSGEWLMVLIDRGPRSAADRASRRTELGRRRLAELREGVWVRPDNLEVVAFDTVGGVTVGSYRPETPVDPNELWDLADLQARALGLGEAVISLTRPLEAGDDSVLARGFVVAAAVLRLFQADPLLPNELLPDGWAAGDLRVAYDRFELAYQALLRAWIRRQQN